METINNHFDLNSLRVLVALEQTRNVSRAAELLDMSQSGFSTALARLRKRLNDDLFVRIPGGMEPTARAMTMVEAARQVLSQVESAILEKPVFSPKTAQAEFHLALTDIAEIVFIPRLLHHLEKEAPEVKIECSSPGQGHPQENRENVEKSEISETKNETFREKLTRGILKTFSRNGAIIGLQRDRKRGQR